MRWHLNVKAAKVCSLMVCQALVGVFTDRSNGVLAICLMMFSAHVYAAPGDGGIWTFVDRDGVAHIGNASSPSGAGRVSWVDRPRAIAFYSDAVTTTKQIKQMAGYEAAKPHLDTAAESHALDPALVLAVAAAESAFKLDAISRKGAVGLMQVMPNTAVRYGVGLQLHQDARKALLDPQINAQVGSRHLAVLLRTFEGDIELALAAYNSGEGTVMKYGRKIPPFPETQNYVVRVMRYYRSLVGLSG